jgi:hypothetical protein
LHHSSIAAQPRVPLQEPRAQGGEGAASIRSKTKSVVVETALWLAVCALVSPLVIYAGEEMMPLAGLFLIAAGIAMAIALAGRQLHTVLVADALGHKTGAARLVLAAGMMLLVILLVLLGAVVALLILFRSARGEAGGAILGWGAGASA